MRLYSEHDTAESALKKALWIETESTIPDIIGYSITRNPDGKGFKLFLIETKDERELR